MQRIAPFSRTRIAISVLIGVSALVFAIVGAWNSPPGDNPAVIQEMTSLLEHFSIGFVRDGTGHITAKEFLNAPTWDDVQKASCHLTWGNQRIAQAKAMVQLDKPPESTYLAIWPDRFEIAKQQSSICTQGKRLWWSVGFGALALTVTIPLSWLVLLAVSWVWYFCLDRLLEVSSSVRDGKDK